MNRCTRGRVPAMGRSPAMMLVALFMVLGHVALTAEAAWEQFDLEGYPVLVLEGPAALEPDVRYVSFTGDFGFREWTPDMEFVRQQAPRESLLCAHFDLNVLNLEFMLPGVTGSPKSKETDAVALAFMKAAGFDLVTRGNNHAMDFGDEGVKYDTELLEESGFATGGVRSHPWFAWKIDGKVIAIYALSRGTDKPDPNRQVLTIDDEDLAWIQRETRSADLRIAFVHLGSMSTFLSPHERQEAQKVIEAGADLVICTGSHFIKGVVREGAVHVAYGIGNYMLTYSDDVTEPAGMHFVAGLRQGELVQLLAIPFANNLNEGVLGPLPADGLAAFANQLKERSVLDTERYYSDPHALKSFKKALFKPQTWDPRRIRPRHLIYGFRIMLRNYPLSTALGLVVFSAVVYWGVRSLVRRRRTTGA